MFSSSRRKTAVLARFVRHALASKRAFCDEIPPRRSREESAQYYANILMRYPSSSQTWSVAPVATECADIAPDHGPVFRRDLGPVLVRYARWSAQKPPDKVVSLRHMWKARISGRQSRKNCAGGPSRKTTEPAKRASLRLANRTLEAARCVWDLPSQQQTFPQRRIATYAAGLKRQKHVGMAFWSMRVGRRGCQEGRRGAFGYGCESHGHGAVQYRPTRAFAACREAAGALSAALRETLARRGNAHGVYAHVCRPISRPSSERLPRTGHGSFDTVKPACASGLPALAVSPHRRSA